MLTFTVIAAPGFKCNAKIDGINSSAAIIIDYEAKVGIICGTEYSGEIKKKRIFNNELCNA